MKTFISFSSADREIVEPFVEMLRLHYIEFFYSDRTLKGGYFAEDIVKAIDQCRKFIVFISPNAMKSEWVSKEVAMAMSRDHLRGKVLPILIADTPNWTQLHPHISKLQKFDHFREPQEVENRIIEGEFNRPRHRHPYYRRGDVTIQVLVMAGGDGQTRFKHGDIVCDGPTKDRTYMLPADVQLEADARIAKKQAECQASGKTFIDNPQVRLIDATQWGGSAGQLIENKPLRLTLGMTNYYSTFLTNMTRDYVLPCGQSIAMKYGRDLDDLLNSGLSNPIATNMTVVTNDNQLFLSTRGHKVAWNPGEFQPAVSESETFQDLDEGGIYDPFRTAISGAQNECTGRYRPGIDEVTFFGLARTMGTQFPFLFGEIRVNKSSDEIGPPLRPEGVPFPIPFTIDGVCDWVRKYHKDHFEGRRGGVIGTTLFSLLQSLEYQFPEARSAIVRRLKS